MESKRIGGELMIIEELEELKTLGLWPEYEREEITDEEIKDIPKIKKVKVTCCNTGKTLQLRVAENGNIKNTADIKKLCLELSTQRDRQKYLQKQVFTEEILQGEESQTLFKLTT